MHEFSIAEALLKGTLKVAEAYGSRPVEQVRVQMGRLRQIVPDILTYAFDVIAKDTLAEGAVLECREVTPWVRCKSCGTAFEPEDIFWVCPACETPGGEVLRGEELILESVVLKDDP